MAGRYNKQAIVVKDMLDKIREEHEAVKFMFYQMDDSEGAKLLIEDTKKKGFFKGRFLSPEMLRLRNSLFRGNNG